MLTLYVSDKVKQTVIDLLNATSKCLLGNKMVLVTWNSEVGVFTEANLISESLFLGYAVGSTQTR